MLGSESKHTHRLPLVGYSNPSRRGFILLSALEHGLAKADAFLPPFTKLAAGAPDTESIGGRTVVNERRWLGVARIILLCAWKHLMRIGGQVNSQAVVHIPMSLRSLGFDARRATVS